MDCHPNNAVATVAPVTHIAVPSIFSLLKDTVVLSAKVVGKAAVLGTAAAKIGIVEANVGMLMALDYGTAGKGDPGVAIYAIGSHPLYSLPAYIFRYNNLDIS